MGLIPAQTVKLDQLIEAIRSDGDPARPGHTAHDIALEVCELNWPQAVLASLFAIVLVRIAQKAAS
jgi:hypothetical protein